MKEGRKPEYPEKTPGDELQTQLCGLCCVEETTATLVYCVTFLPSRHRLDGLVVKASASRAEDPWF